MITWQPGRPGNERAVPCCGCGAQIAVAEARYAIIGRGRSCVFSCSSACEDTYEASHPDTVAGIAAELEAERAEYWASTDRTWNR